MVKKINFSVIIESLSNQYTIFPLGDAAATIDLGNHIDLALNEKVIAMQQWLQLNEFEGMKDTILGYSGLTIIYDPFIIKVKFAANGTAFDFIKQKLQQAYYQSLVLPSEEAGIISIPVCYAPEYGTDLHWLAEQKGISVEEIIRLHTQRIYRVYMIGFLPGFSYMAAIDPVLITPRKSIPVPVRPGTVAIAGAQTGIYPFACPGGWNIIGRTPVSLFDAHAEKPVLLKAGDRVQFYGIHEDEMKGA